MECRIARDCFNTQLDTTLKLYQNLNVLLLKPAHRCLLVEKNGCLAVKPKSIKLTYAKSVRLQDTVEAQIHLIAKGGDPTNESISNDLFINDQVKVDIKAK
jgi:hypothetical protein